jgi:hypothetical protein
MGITAHPPGMLTTSQFTAAMRDKVLINDDGIRWQQKPRLKTPPDPKRPPSETDKPAYAICRQVYQSQKTGRLHEERQR